MTVLYMALLPLRFWYFVLFTGRWVCVSLTIIDIDRYGFVVENSSWVNQHRASALSAILRYIYIYTCSLSSSFISTYIDLTFDGDSQLHSSRRRETEILFLLRHSCELSQCPSRALFSLLVSLLSRPPTCLDILWLYIHPLSSLNFLKMRRTSAYTSTAIDYQWVTSIHRKILT